MFSDPSGNAPGLQILTSLHNAVVRDAIKVLKYKGGYKNCVTQWATYKEQKGGRPNGYMDIYHYEENRVWEVKRNNKDRKKLGKEQLDKYERSYRTEKLSNLFNARQTKPVRGRPMSGTYSTKEGIYDITYKWEGALILYDYKVNPWRATAAGVVAVGLAVLTIATAGAAAPVAVPVFVELPMVA